MASVRIKDSTHKILRELAELSNESLQAILIKAVEQYRRQKFFEEADSAYAALRSDPKAWKDELEDRALWDTTLMDDLEDDEY